eukprot:TRINITY_DN4862_c0_g1_i8.p1 TRINITY_DN4862_c0_g1~~TRINITY_DN4862_c0_g1_i8.p1  ORF type:complete len:607 (-),score=246.35 TRINITY_DN4862_c0_g1_i8:42-1862(-)
MDDDEFLEESEQEESGQNPLEFLGLRRVGSETEGSPMKNEEGIELNSRGIPARKKKKNSLIYGADDLVSIPVKSPKKRVAQKPAREPEKSKKEIKTRLKKFEVEDEDEDEFEDDEELEEQENMADSIDKSINFYEDNIDEPDSPVPIKTPKEMKVKPELDEEMSVANRLNAQRLGVTLRNLLKLPKAHKWVCFEFFYSNIDKVLFQGENDFSVCLRESFPQLKTRRLARVEWCKVRRLMGKPRRCSEAFFSEERAELDRKRKKMRLLQQRKMGDSSSYKDLPEDIPMQLTIGSRVTARLRLPQDGLFTGCVAAVDTSNSTYRITFDRQGLGTHSIPDYEVLSMDPPDMMPLSSFMSKARHRPMQNISTYLSPPPYGSAFSPQLTGDPLLSGSTPKGKSLRLDGTLGGYPVKFLYHIVRLNKSLQGKKEKVNNLRDLNSEAEKMKSFGEFITEDFQRKYASTVLEVYKINEELNKQLKDMSLYTAQFGTEAGPTLSLPEQIKENCQEESYDMVNKYNTQDNAACVQSPKLLSLITSLSALMLQVKRVADGERDAAELQALKESVADIQSTLSGDNLKVFQDCVEVHMQHIQQGLSQMGNLTAFMADK